MSGLEMYILEARHDHGGGGGVENADQTGGGLPIHLYTVADAAYRATRNGCEGQLVLEQATPIHWSLARSCR